MVFEFAIASGHLAIEDDNLTARVYTLRSGRLVLSLPPARGAYWLWASCGRLWAQDNGRGSAFILPRAEVQPVACKRPSAPEMAIHDYRVSPNGLYLATLSDTQNRPNFSRICIEKTPGATACTDMRQADDISVSNDGAVLIGAALGERCYTNGVGAQVPFAAGPPPPDYNEFVLCTAVFSWSPAGQREPLAKYSSQPQWLSPAEAADLAQLAASPAAAHLH